VVAVLGGRYSAGPDPSWYSRWNSSTQQQANARVTAPRAHRPGADSLADAPAICLDACGRVRISEVARLLGTGEHDAQGSWLRWCSMTRSPAA
jgi:hypothetical protein